MLSRCASPLTPLSQIVGRDRQTLEQRQRAAAVVDADDKNGHVSTSLGRCATSTIAGNSLEFRRFAYVRTALLVIAQNLQFNGKIDFPNADAVRRVDDRRSEVQNARDPSRHERICGVLSCNSWRCDHPDRDLPRVHNSGQLIKVAHTHATDDSSDLGRIDIDHATNRKPALSEPAVARKGVAEMAGADDNDMPFVRQTQLPFNLEN